MRLLFAAGAADSIVSKGGKTPLDLGGGDPSVVGFFEMLAKAEDAKKLMAERTETKEALKRVAAAVVLQSGVRGRKARSVAAAAAHARAHAARELAATKVQAMAKGRAVRSNMGHKGKLNRSDNAARRLADWHVVSTEKSATDLAFGLRAKHNEYEDAEARHPWAATMLQSRQRGRSARRLVRSEFADEITKRQAAVEAKAAARAEREREAKEESERRRRREDEEEEHEGERKRLTSPSHNQGQSISLQLVVLTPEWPLSPGKSSMRVWWQVNV